MVLGVTVCCVVFASILENMELAFLLSIPQPAEAACHINGFVVFLFHCAIGNAIGCVVPASPCVSS